jgi:hypothetical protein
MAVAHEILVPREHGKIWWRCISILGRECAEHVHKSSEEARRNDEINFIVSNVLHYMLSSFPCYTYYYSIDAASCGVLYKSIPPSPRLDLTLKHQQSLPFQPPQTVHITTCLHDGLHRRLTQLPPLLCCFLLTSRFRL